MIEPNKVRSMKVLNATKEALDEFIAFDRSVMLSVYTEEYGWNEDDYEADKEQAAYLLEQVNRRMKSLGNHLSKAGKNASPATAPPATQESPVETA